MSWITLAEDDVKLRLAGAELNALKSVELADGLTNPLPEIISQVVEEVRGYVAACPRNALGETGTIPTQLESAALSIIRARLTTRLPLSLSEARKTELANAQTLLRDVAACRFTVSQPVGAADTSVDSAPSPTISAGSRRFGRDAQDGI